MKEINPQETTRAMALDEDGRRTCRTFPGHSAKGD